MRGIEPLKRFWDRKSGHLRASDNPRDSPKGLRCVGALLVPRVERRRHQPRRLARRDDGDILARQAIDNAARERAADETIGIDAGDTRTQNLLQVGA